MNHNWIHHPENTLETEHDQCVRGPLDPYPSLRISERCLLASICFMRDFQPYLVATSQCLTLFILKYPTFSLKIRDPYPLSTGESSFSPIKSVLVGLFPGSVLIGAIQRLGESLLEGISRWMNGWRTPFFQLKGHRNHGWWGTFWGGCTAWFIGTTIIQNLFSPLSQAFEHC